MGTSRNRGGDTGQGGVPSTQKTADQHNAIRRASKRGPKGGKASRVGLGIGEKPLFERIADYDGRPSTVRPVAIGRPPFRQRFIESFGHHVTIVAERKNWSLTTRQLACAYIKALINGDGQMPEGLQDEPAKAIQRKFATTCAFMNPREGSFPGQAQEWYSEEFKGACTFRASLRRKVSDAA